MELSKVKFASEITFLFCLLPKGFFPFAFSAWQYTAYNQKRLNPFPFSYTIRNKYQFDFRHFPRFVKHFFPLFLLNQPFLMQTSGWHILHFKLFVLAHNIKRDFPFPDGRHISLTLEFFGSGE